MQTMKDKSAVIHNGKPMRMFAPFKDEEHFNRMHNAVLNGMPKKNHFDVTLLLQMTISTFREKPKVADRLFK